MSRSKATSAAAPVASAARRMSGRKRTKVDLYRPSKALESEPKRREKERYINISCSSERKPIPTRNKNGQLVFADYPHFVPNMTPEEVIRAGSFGGTYFRPIYSSVTKQQYEDEAWKELPEEWLRGLNIKRMVSSATYNVEVNKYGEKCGQGLDEWESSGWITSIDPYGWFQWYCRFYLGRRCSDDERQISRGLGVMGPKGRWKNNLINKMKLHVHDKGVDGALNDFTISPKIRQLLQHWGYSVTRHDLK